ncbi:putative ATPase of the PP-loop superfamily [Thermogladius calderae 1633]|uniref:Putative ATPase of the PP-loop superfamily n=1 Tax=Thermogladius calderae (strain DSM 22663 / VKM B-2946 / 1633) TaxID=1184251 RepID=I3TGD0_THEC1|nr:ATP-binding protein [Thermogladius calderae]AFK51818.1 putative ATPase of the PP-loop superfamily [Thermogladius calderae 1633]
MVKCHYCEREAVVRLPYAKLNLCREHFAEYLLRKLERSVNRYKMFGKGSRVVVGVSGGKDSVTLTKLLSESGLAKMLVVHVNLAIGEYSRISVETVRRFSVEHGLDYLIVDLSEYGIGIPELVAKTKRSPCSVCGMVKRYVLNALTMDLGYDALATAHHGDDMAVYIVKSFLLQDYDQLYKISPVNYEVPGLAARKVKPLYEFYEFEVETFAKLYGLPFVSVKCPFKHVGWLESYVRELLDRAEEESPGFKVSLLRSHARRTMSMRSAEQAQPKACASCGLISSGTECSFCRFTRRALGQPMGLVVRRWIIGKAVAGETRQVSGDQPSSVG